MSYCTLAIEFLELKYFTNYLFYQLFLSPPDFFFPSHSLRCRCFFFSHKPMKSEKKRKKKEEAVERMREKKNLEEGEIIDKISSCYNNLIQEIQLLMYSSSSDLMSYCSLTKKKKKRVLESLLEHEQ